MDKFDIAYANEQLDLIDKLANELRDLFYTKERNALKICECHHTICKTIGGYFEYLGKTGVNPDKSYLVKWLDEDRNRWLLDDIYDYLHDHN